MKYVYTTILCVSVLILTTNTHAAIMLNWTVDSRPASELFGEMIPAGKSSGKMRMIEDYSGNMIYIKSFDMVKADNIMWDGLPDMKSVGGQALIMSCYLGGCIIIPESNNVVSTDNNVVSTKNDEGSFQAAPVPIPAAAWLFMSGLFGLVWKARKVR